MFDLFAMLLSSITSFLFPIFASYKALKSSDPAELTPWLMYWVVFNCTLLAESWVYFIVSWIPFYGYFRLFFFLYLILPQTQGARWIYEDKIHPYLAENEEKIDEFIASAHNRATEAGVAYLKMAIEYVRVNVGLPPTEAPPPPPPGPQSYTQSLLSRFSVPAAKWAAPSNTPGASGGSDFYSLLSGAVAAATGAGGFGGSANASSHNVNNSETLIPSNLRDSHERMDFIAAQRDRLNIVLSALEREAQNISRDGTLRPGEASRRAPSSASYDGPEDYEATQRPPSGLSAWSGLSKSRSEADFEKIDAESGAEDDPSIRRRNISGPSSNSSWSPFGGWGGSGSGSNGDNSGSGGNGRRPERGGASGLDY